MKTVNAIKMKSTLAAALCTGLAVAVASIASCTPKSALVGNDAQAAHAVKPGPGEFIAITPPAETPRVDSSAFEEDARFGDSLTRVEFAQIEDDVISRDADRRPVTGGKARIYLQRGFLDDALSEMIRLYPFGAEGQERRVFSVADSTHRRLEFKMAGQMRRGDGRKVTALDFVELWSRLLKSRPAQGIALFRNVQGAEDYVKGKEPLVGGFNAADESTVKIRFAKPDPIAYARLNSPILVGGPFMLGPYYTSDRKDAELKLLPNANSVSDTAYLAECAVQMGGDPNALMSFSLGQYSAMTLYAAADLKIARTEFAGRASLRKLPSDRYFLACKIDDEQARRFVRGAANGADLLNAVGAEGEEIFSVSARGEAAEQPRGGAAVPQLPKPLRIVFRSDDPVSAAIAGKLSADLNSAGLASEPVGGDAGVYEKALFTGAYDCAVGWAAETVLDDFAEQLHLASMWFADETDSRIRLREYREIPLFSVDNYLLLRDDVRLYKNRLTGMWIDGGGK